MELGEKSTTITLLNHYTTFQISSLCSQITVVLTLQQENDSLPHMETIRKPPQRIKMHMVTVRENVN